MRGVPDRLGGASTVLLAVPDDTIRGVAAELARRAAGELRGRTVLHTSGALDCSVLEPLRRAGAAVGSLHPLQTFDGVSVPPLEGKVFTIEGDKLAVHTAKRIVRALGGVPVCIRPAQKPLYHAAGAFAAGLLLALEEAAVRLMSSAGFPRGEAERSVLSLARQVLEHTERRGPQKAWTGPLARRDYGVVAAHKHALQPFPAEYFEAYRAVSRLAARVLSHDAQGMLRRLQSVFEERPDSQIKGEKGEPTTR